MYLAHLAPEHCDGSPEPLALHLRRVADKARALAVLCRPQDTAFSDEAWIAGLLHDLGKYRDCWLEYLLGHAQSTPHAPYGAAAARERGAVAAAFAIAAHHSGLRDPTWLKERCGAAGDLGPLLAKLERDNLPLPPAQVRHSCDALFEEMRTRMLFSVLVEADRSMTAMHHEGRERSSAPLDASFLARLLDFRNALAERRAAGCSPAVLQTRHQVFQACLDRGRDWPPGLFSLTVPTGGGKTLAAMAFALSHASAHGLRRVFSVIPYLSIIEQSAAVYASALEPEHVLEHHSNMDPAGSEDREDATTAEMRAAGLESWNAPVIVTTAVQFLETLFSASAARARRLQSVARSVVILDEVQTLPPRLLNPIADALRALVRDWGASVVFCTATQPGFRRCRALPAGFETGEVREIASDPAKSFRALKRVEFQVDPPERQTNWGDLASEFAKEPRALCVVNLVRHAAVLWEELCRRASTAERDSIFHLSTRMCAQHRLDVLGAPSNALPETIRGRLAAGLPCRVVSTQLVEAGGVQVCH